MEPIDFECPGTRTLTDHKNIQTAMPLGGLGAGCLCINGQGGFQDFSIRNRPELSAMPDGHGHVHDTAFGLIHIKSRGNTPAKTRLLEGPLPLEKVYAFGIKSQGYRHGGKDGLPRFSECSFRGNFPFAEVKLSDPDLPLSSRITGWSPFIPNDARSTGMPVSIAEYAFQNSGDEPLDIVFSFHLSHLSQRKRGDERGLSKNRVISDRGVFFYNTESPGSEQFGSAALVSLGAQPKIKAMWFRGGWFDSVSMLWKEASSGDFHQNDGTDCDQSDGWNGGSICFEATIPPEESVCFPIGIAWYFPNVHFQFGHEPREPNSEATPEPWWRPWYTTQWKDAEAVACELIDQFKPLRTRTNLFYQTLTAMTAPTEIVDAISANLAILKSPTVMRQENGNFWAWEGCFPDRGSCHGNCTHVWNYAQALPHLFPELERTLREQEYLFAMDDDGYTRFRFSVPTTKMKARGIAAADGQLGGMIKLYRDWQISGNDVWLADLYPLVRKSLEYCIKTWDPKEMGGLIEPHHNTYDIEFHGPDGFCGSVYLGALTAMSTMAEHLNNTDDAIRYGTLRDKAAAFLDSQLFNGEYYVQHIISNQESKTVDYSNGTNELHKLLQDEGPKYQYGQGCLSDGVFGIWLSSMCGVQTPINCEHLQSALKAIFGHNFKTNLEHHANPQRPGYALGNESALLLCTWPKGGRPSLPFVYSDEAWTGIEYQVASHLILEGFVKQGLEIVKAVRQRYDGQIRNPWNEYECGSYYARAMASYGLIQAWSGFQYSKVSKTLWLEPKSTERPFRTFFSCDGAFGNIQLTADEVAISVCEGELIVERVIVEGKSLNTSGGKALPGTNLSITLSLS